MYLPSTVKFALKPVLTTELSVMKASFAGPLRVLVADGADDGNPQIGGPSWTQLARLPVATFVVVLYIVRLSYSQPNRPPNAMNNFSLL
jgi:hypothetical protein